MQCDLVILICARTINDQTSHVDAEISDVFSVVFIAVLRHAFGKPVKREMIEQVK